MTSLTDSFDTADRGLSGDFGQAIVICKNEMKKFLRGKKFMIFGIIMLIIIALETIVPYVVGHGYDSADEFTNALISTMGLIIELAAVLFTSTSIVSEFQERTALILFTKPVRKRAIFIGKAMASMAIVSAFVLGYYVFTALITLILEGAVVATLWKSAIVALFVIFAVTGLAMMISSIAKNGGTAIILTLLLLVLMLGLVAGLLSEYAHIDSWWCITDAINYLVSSMDLQVYGVTPASAEDITRAIGILFIWGVVCNIVGYVIFKRRDF